MNIFQKTAQRIKTLTSGSISYFLGSGNNFQSMTFSDGNLDTMAQMTYKKSLYIQAGMKRVKDAFSAVEFKLYKIKNSKGELEEIVAHEILDLLYNPNPFQTRLEFFRLMAAYFSLSNEAFIRILRAEGTNKIQYLTLLEPKDVDVKFNSKTGKLEYLTTEDGKQLTILQENMIHVKDPDPSNQLRGESLLAPILERALAEAYGISYQRGIFARNGNPDAVIAFKTVTDANSLKELKASFKNSFNGKNEDTRVAVVGGEIDVKQLNTSGNILDYKTSQDLIRDDIMMALGVPKALVTSDDVNRANADAALQQFMQFTIAPMIMLFIEALNERFVIPNYGEELYLGTEKLVIEDKELLLKELAVTVHGQRQVSTINEARARLGLDAIEGQDQLTTISNTIQPAPEVAKNIFRNRRKLYLVYRAQEAMAKQAQVNLYKTVTETKEFKTKYKSAIEATRNQAEAKLARDTKKMFKEQYDRIVTKLEEVGDSFTNARDLFDYDTEKELTTKALLPTFAKVTQDAGNVALLPVSLLAKKDIRRKADEFILTSRVYTKIEERTKLFSTSITKTTYEALSVVVSEHIHEGVEELKKALKNTFYGGYLGRIDTIARTESCYMTSLGTQLAYEESSVVSGKQWMTTGDGLVRPEHVQVDGQIVDVNNSFSNGEYFPGENSINCRCAIAPVVDVNNL